MCLVLGIRSSVGVLALPFRQTKPFQLSCHSRKSILGSVLTVLNACFSIKLRLSLELQFGHRACMFRISRKLYILNKNIYTRYVYTLQKQMTSKEFAHEHVFKGLNDR